ncbi:50S ribosomal protein L11 [Candidatus Pacearchaeota archaeon CG_4_9_14_0_2_um_filter_39_13]|nr:50S ribosomal protein L11 [Candidatus Pacearchaeota archaeon]PJC44404.1 MAG: 50S ribosomal protein L11 [Candidatus Pacearchaeota archaeon CG_4_9_14_0_2_um_filter_39_13]
MKIKLIVDGGSMKPGPAVAQQLGPMGINMGKVIQEVNEATAGFKGMKVPVELDVNKTTKEFTVSVSSPPVSELIKKELNLEKGSGEAGNVKVGNISVEQLIGIAKTKMLGMLARDLKAALKLVIGSCKSLGILVDSKDPVEIIAEVNEGKYDSEIKQEKTELSDEKRRTLENKFAEVKAKQDKDKKALEEAKAKEEAEKAEAAAAATTAAPGAKPAAAAVVAPAAKAPEAKKEEKKKK